MGLRVEVPTPIGSPDFYRYRNKMEFSFSGRRWLTRVEVASGALFDRGFALGLHVPGAYDRVLHLETCPLQTEIADQILEATGRFARDSARPPFDLRRGEGFYRYLTVRVGIHTGETLVVLVTSERDPALMEAYKGALETAGVLPSSLYNGVTNRPAATSEGAELYHDDGTPTIRERLDKWTFLLGPDTFFQPNTRAAERLLFLVREWAELGRNEEVIDLYCGVGTLSLAVASAARRVMGLERSGASVALAKRNALENGIANAEFAVTDLDAGIPPEVEPLRPQLVLVDPPRAGIHPKALRALREKAPARILYVSCYPVSQAENVAALCSEGLYRLERIQLIDQFPHTEHIECVALLRRQRRAMAREPKRFEGRS